MALPQNGLKKDGTDGAATDRSQGSYSDRACHGWNVFFLLFFLLLLVMIFLWKYVENLCEDFPNHKEKSKLSLCILIALGHSTINETY